MNKLYRVFLHTYDAEDEFGKPDFNTWDFLVRNVRSEAGAISKARAILVKYHPKSAAVEDKKSANAFEFKFGSSEVIEL